MICNRPKNGPKVKPKMGQNGSHKWAKMGAKNGPKWEPEMGPIVDQTRSKARDGPRACPVEHPEHWAVSLAPNPGAQE